jgi:F0F1-type ATP synthase membrane subunit b/b'
LRDTRNRANEKIRAAKESIAGEIAAARSQLDQDTQSLGAEIARTILERRPPASPSVEGAQ